MLPTYSNHVLINSFVWLSFLLILLSVLILIFFDTGNSFQHNTDNSRYLYSAIFQGFAALLAITITVVMVTFQGLSTHIQNLQNRIFTIIGKSLPDIRPIDLIDYHYYVDFRFKDDLTKEMENESYINKDVAIKSLSDELIQIIDDMDKLRNTETLLRQHFIPCLVIIVVILIYSLTALFSFIPEDNERTPFDISPVVILNIAYFITLYGVVSMSYFFGLILNTWKTRFEQNRARG